MLIVRLVANLQEKQRKITQVLANDEGMTTLEYALGLVAAAALAGVLYVIVKSPAVYSAFEGIITDALANGSG
ncbi:DUF4244 domain-containing protein [Corynebacterium caspium]|uniref:DUF4244 domain-containing protein n=1 Tax=Corynebacterium caspium TaxID=234828 RepID=UPI0003743019|nr:DUF4244 domain-containing protein [Corynebacterium caspium]WKD58576.1 hypothetical protein CCASP_00740 [Corynebacterium caspium DSM 44850]